MCDLNVLVGALRMQRSESIDSPSLFASDDTFNAIVQQWAKSRIDIPMQIIGRFDDAGKQLITIGSTLQGLYIAIFTFGNVKNQVPLGWLAVLSASLCLLVFCAAQAICTVPLKMEARDTYRLFRRRPDLPDADLTAALEKWCK